MQTNSGIQRLNHKFPQTNSCSVSQTENFQYHGCYCQLFSRPLCWRRCSGQTTETTGMTRHRASERKRSKRVSCIQRTRRFAAHRTCWNVWCSKTEHRAAQTDSLSCTMQVTTSHKTVPNYKNNITVSMSVHQLSQNGAGCIVKKNGQNQLNPFNTSCSKLLVFEGFSAILV